MAIALRLDPGQRFTCSQCGRCCRRPWEIVVTRSETETYRQAQAARWYRETEGGPEGTDRDPFEPLPSHLPFHRIRKRDDGACGFLSPRNRCRIHEELGGARKPLTCRMFPYRFHPVEQAVLVTTSFCCPTTLANEGDLISQQRPEIAVLRSEWFGVHSEKGAGAIRFAGSRPITTPTLDAVRSLLAEILDRPGPGGPPDLRVNALRLGLTLEDWTRYRVLRLPDEAFAEYLQLTGRHAATSDRAIAPRPPSRVGRLLQRGFLFVVGATRVQMENRTASGLRLGLRLRLVRLLLHVHGLGPPVSGIDVRAVARREVGFADPEVHAAAHHFLRASLRGLGTGRRAVADEVGVAFSFLNAGCALAAMRAEQTQAPIDGPLFREALMEAVDLTHAGETGGLGRVLTTLAGGVEAVYVFAARRG
jgi:Fe-S-cluster containining protein